MTTGNEPPREEATDQERTDWATEAEAALEGVGNALREAWNASREARLAALESAKQAAQQLGDAIDHGVAAARQKWESQAATSPSGADVAGEAHTPQMRPDEGRED